ncbi:hypothetical protein PA08_0456 [Cutibacterium modestum P08]|uniref:Uncharacterized protein n=1 Tax=Cutibacterium modestum HL044PA1 TaxID=765109 RepID=A0ABP2K8K9_9ACTN|nr:hypothetical protein HMPREF9607_01827 [Cutibacterium modestum HL044PA1]EGG27769.1 hypothetical protein PA08_0456 [Cutibacterium modestum P08]
MIILVDELRMLLACVFLYIVFDFHIREAESLIVAVAKKHEDS